MKNKAAQQLGRLGGKSTSEAKQSASRENGKKGGRHKKSCECDKCASRLSQKVLGMINRDVKIVVDKPKRLG